MWKDDGGTNDFLLLVFVQHEDQKQQILGAAYVVAAIQLVPSYGHSKMPIQLIPSYGQSVSNGRTEELSWIGVEWPYRLEECVEEGHAENEWFPSIERRPYRVEEECNFEKPRDGPAKRRCTPQKMTWAPQSISQY